MLKKLNIKESLDFLFFIKYINNFLVYMFKIINKSFLRCSKITNMYSIKIHNKPLKYISKKVWILIIFIKIIKVFYVFMVKII